MPICKNDDKAMVFKDDRWACPDCKYVLHVAHKVLSHDEALKEIERLKPFEKMYWELREILNDHSGSHDELEEYLHNNV